MVVLLSPSMRLCAMPVRLPLALLLANSLCSNMPAPILASALLHVCVTTHMLAFAASRKALLAKRLVVGRVDLSIDFSNHVSCATRQQHRRWKECAGAAGLRKRASGGGKQAVAAVASVASTTPPSLERAKGGGRPPGAVAASSGGTGFAGLDNNTVAGKTEKGRPTSGSGGGKQWRHWFRWPRRQHRHWKE